jgi:hypothetical protein
MLTEFDQSTIANMTAALEYVCRKIPPGKDTHELRKQLGDAMIKLANGGKCTFVDFREAGLKELEEIIRTPKSHWLRRLIRWGEKRHCRGPWTGVLCSRLLGRPRALGKRSRRRIGTRKTVGPMGR